jgi:hypothetical protein
MPAGYTVAAIPGSRYNKRVENVRRERDKNAVTYRFA